MQIREGLGVQNTDEKRELDRLGASAPGQKWEVFRQRLSRARFPAKLQQMLPVPTTATPHSATDSAIPAVLLVDSSVAPVDSFFV
jgi:hypothetical protein